MFSSNHHQDNESHPKQDGVVDSPLVLASFMRADEEPGKKGSERSDRTTEASKESGPRQESAMKEEAAASEDVHVSEASQSSGKAKGSMGMRVLKYLMDKAQSSGFYRYLLNKVLRFTIPFNQPHGIAIEKISQEKLEVSLPYKRKNCNHLQGLHACALATVSEFSSGVLLLNHLDPGRYRIIMESLEMKYHKQGRSSVTAKAELPVSRVSEEVLEPLKTGSVARITMNAEVYDDKGVHICTGTTHWHIKEWKATKDIGK